MGALKEGFGGGLVFVLLEPEFSEGGGGAGVVLGRLVEVDGLGGETEMIFGSSEVLSRGEGFAVVKVEGVGGLLGGKFGFCFLEEGEGLGGESIEVGGDGELGEEGDVVGVSKGGFFEHEAGGVGLVEGEVAFGEFERCSGVIVVEADEFGFVREGGELVALLGEEAGEGFVGEGLVGVDGDDVEEGLLAFCLLFV